MVLVDLVHDATPETSDAWIETQVEQIQTGPDWQLRVHRVVTTALTHDSLTRL